jgi:hypothetical protein
MWIEQQKRTTKPQRAENYNSETAEGAEGAEENLDLATTAQLSVVERQFSCNCLNSFPSDERKNERKKTERNKRERKKVLPFRCSAVLCALCALCGFVVVVLLNQLGRGGK